VSHSPDATPTTPEAGTRPGPDPEPRAGVSRAALWGGVGAAVAGAAAATTVIALAVRAG